MNKRIKQLWIDRLENGDIVQTRGSLGRVDGSRCCLGVLCDLAVESGIIFAPSRSVSGSVNFDGSFGALPTKVQQWAEISYCGEYRGMSLAGDNDSGASFTEIAQTIRKEF